MQSALVRLVDVYPMIADLSPASRTRLLESVRRVSLPGGRVLFDEHQSCEGFPFIVEGAIRVLKSAPTGRELPLYRITAGATCIISSACLLGRKPYNARGVTDGETVLMSLPQAVFDELLDETPFRVFVFRLFAERIADLMQVIEVVAFQKLDQRLAALLLGKGRLVHVTHQRLADELGSVREFVSRLLKGFSDQGLVRLSREEIEILDPAGLRKLAGGGH